MIDIGCQVLKWLKIGNLNYFFGRISLFKGSFLNSAKMLSPAAVAACTLAIWAAWQSRPGNQVKLSHCRQHFQNDTATENAASRVAESLEFIARPYKLAKADKHINTFLKKYFFYKFWWNHNIVLNFFSLNMKNLSLVAKASCWALTKLLTIILSS